MGLNFLGDENADKPEPKRPASLDDILGPELTDDEVRERFGDDALNMVTKVEGTGQELINLFLSALVKKEAQDPSVAMDLFIAGVKIKEFFTKEKPEDVMALIAHLATRQAQLLLMVTEDDDEDGDDVPD